jgi:hypothetical protein
MFCNRVSDARASTSPARTTRATRQTVAQNLNCFIHINVGEFIQ